MEERNRLIDALNVIKEECSKYYRCSDCPLRFVSDSGACCSFGKEDPNKWNIKEKEKGDPWRAFK